LNCRFSAIVRRQNTHDRKSGTSFSRTHDKDSQLSTLMTKKESDNRQAHSLDTNRKGQFLNEDRKVGITAIVVRRSMLYNFRKNVLHQIRSVIVVSIKTICK
jgi:hypothetical protein